MSKPNPLAKVVWLDRGWQPVFIGFCPSRKAWNAAMRRLGVPLTRAPFPTTAGAATWFESNEGKKCIVVTLEPGCEKRLDRLEIAGLLCHEATHVWQHVKECMAESEPSREFEAYSMQAIFQNLYQAWLDTRCPPEMRSVGRAKSKGR